MEYYARSGDVQIGSQYSNSMQAWSSRVLLGKSNKELGDYDDIQVSMYTPSITTYDDVALIDKLKSAYAADIQLQKELKEAMAEPRVHAHKKTHFCESLKLALSWKLMRSA